MKRLLGLYRERQYSPGRHLSNDVRLLDQIAHRLRERDFEVELLTLDEAEPRHTDAEIIFRCARENYHWKISTTGKPGRQN